MSWERQGWTPEGYAPTSHYLAAAMLLLAALALTGCVTSPPVYVNVPECDKLVPEMLLADVPGVPIPESEEAEPWMQAFLGQSGQLEKANERPDAVFHIMKTCEDMHRKAGERSQRGFFGRLFS